MRQHPPRRLTRGLVLAAVLSLTAACADSDPGPAEEARAEASSPVAGADASSRVDRPATRTDTIRIEGMAEPVELRLFRTPDGFPIPFSTYVPEDMEPSGDASGRTAHFTAEFGGVRNEDAFLHFYVFPQGTPLQETLALMKGYKTSRGVPVSQGLEPIADELPRPDLRWATEDAYRFLYESGDSWYTGTVGVGEWNDRYYMMVQHYPQEYGDGFGPRTALILDRWQWADGSSLGQGEDR